MLKNLEDVRSLLTRPSNLRVHMAAHVERLSAHLNDVSLVNVWINEFVPCGFTSADERYVLLTVMHFTVATESECKCLTCNQKPTMLLSATSNKDIFMFMMLFGLLWSLRLFYSIYYISDKKTDRK